MRSMVAPMMAISRAARSSIRSTARASQVGLSHSTQARKPCSMVSESRGGLAGFMMCPPGWAGMFGVRCGPFTRRIGGEFVKGKHGAFGPSRCEVVTTVFLASLLIVDFLGGALAEMKCIYY